jgi:hypothetical protein
MTIAWNGTAQDSLDLMRVVNRHCSCEFGLMGGVATRCAAHRMLTEDRRALNGLLFSRRIVSKLRDEEWRIVGRMDTGSAGEL